ncbi:hypothetical protein N9N67_07520 [Bacteriovoracaceae bacterium]|nr:hypothetical protein [Bacteriovoracaceae bacterium]
MKKSILCVGCGNMMNAIFRHKELSQLANDYFFYNRTYDKASKLSSFIGGTAIKDISELKEYDFVFLGVKPQNLDSMEFLKAHLNNKTTIVSLLAAIDLNQLQNFFSHKKIVRLMPNLGAFVQEGVYLKIDTENVTNEANSLINQILSFSGETFELKDEQSFDHLTLFSSCMPGVISNLFDLISKQMTSMNSEEDKKRLLTKTLIGTAQYLKIEGSSESFNEVTNRVASKGGITQALNASLEKSGLELVFKKGFESALLRARELKNL